MGRLTTVLLLALLLLSSLLAASPAPAGAIPTETGCPSRWQVLAVDELLAQGYRVPAIVDAEGNRNGTICGHAYSEAARQQLCGPN